MRRLSVSSFSYLVPVNHERLARLKELDAPEVLITQEEDPDKWNEVIVTKLGNHVTEISRSGGEISTLITGVPGDRLMIIVTSMAGDPPTYDILDYTGLSLQQISARQDAIIIEQWELIKKHVEAPIREHHEMRDHLRGFVPLALREKLTN